MLEITRHSDTHGWFIMNDKFFESMFVIIFFTSLPTQKPYKGGGRRELLLLMLVSTTHAA